MKRKRIIIVIIVFAFIVLACGNMDYKIVKNKIEESQEGKKQVILATTNDKLDKEGIENMLNKILEKNKDNKTPTYIYLSDDKTLTSSTYSLGSISYIDGKKTIVCKTKDWSLKPSKKDYKLYKKFHEIMVEENYNQEISKKILMDKSGETIENIDRVVEKIFRWVFNDEIN